MRPSRRLAIFTAAVGALTACQSSAPQFSAADQAAVRGLFDSTVAYVNAKNWSGWAGLFSDSAVFQAPNSKAIHGRTAIQAFGHGFPPMEQFAMGDVHVWGEGNVAYGTSTLIFKIKDAPIDSGKQMVVSRRSAAGRWEVAAVSFNTDLPLPPAAPPVAPRKKK
jgi:ketosteroid isomerase-like protein